MRKRRRRQGLEEMQHQALVIPRGRFCLPWEHPEVVEQATLAFVA